MAVGARVRHGRVRAVAGRSRPGRSCPDPAVGFAPGTGTAILADRGPRGHRRADPVPSCLLRWVRGDGFARDLLLEYVRGILPATPTRSALRLPPLEASLLRGRGEFGLTPREREKWMQQQSWAAAAARDFLQRPVASLTPLTPEDDVPLSTNYPSVCSTTLTVQETSELRYVTRQQEVTVNDLLLRDLVADHRQLAGAPGIRRRSVLVATDGAGESAFRRGPGAAGRQRREHGVSGPSPRRLEPAAAAACGASITRCRSSSGSGCAGVRPVAGGPEGPGGGNRPRRHPRHLRADEPGGRPGRRAAAVPTAAVWSSATTVLEKVEVFAPWRLRDQHRAGGPAVRRPAESHAALRSAGPGTGRGRTCCWTSSWPRSDVPPIASSRRPSGRWSACPPASSPGPRPKSIRARG